MKKTVLSSASGVVERCVKSTPTIAVKIVVKEMLVAREFIDA
jgi:hypothetical protein